jgi:hypothetical protein
MSVDEAPPSAESATATRDEETTPERLAATLEEHCSLNTTTTTLVPDAKEKGPPSPPPLTILCDLGYGIPKEARPRKEKLLAIAKQLVTFLTWQQQASCSSCDSPAAATNTTTAARLILVSCPDVTVQDALRARMHELWTCAATTDFPTSLLFSPDSLPDWCARHSSGDPSPVTGLVTLPTAVAKPSTTSNNNNKIVYLSPDAPDVLDATQAPPSVVVVGLLIDRRRIQTNKSRNRAAVLQLPSARWPLDQVVANVHACEPLNVDCVLEGMQQWHWNYYHSRQHQHDTAPSDQTAFRACADAMMQALEHHAARHPARPVHKV